MPVPPHRADSAGIRFAPSGTVPGYISMNQHRGGAVAVRNRWSVAPPTEYLIFEASYLGGWVCSRGRNWGLEPGLKAIGANDECIALFPKAANSADDRHGYPVSAQDHKRREEHRPPPAVTAAWRASGLISDLQKTRIDRGKV